MGLIMNYCIFCLIASLISSSVLFSLQFVYPYPGVALDRPKQMNRFHGRGMDKSSFFPLDSDLRYGLGQAHRGDSSTWVNVIS